MTDENSFAAGAASVQGLTMPPGFAGHLAWAIFNGSYIQLHETAIPATIALLAGVVGRAYRTPTGKDLSQYMILVAPMAVGKDAIHDGIPRVLELAGSTFINPDRFVRREDLVSGAALHRAVLETPGFVNLQGEFGRKLKQMANPQNGPMQDFRTKMTRLYSAGYMEGKTHSKAEDSLPGIHCPAFSFLGETTPRTFLDLLTNDMLEDGFLSRFLITFYDGERPPATKDRAYGFNSGVNPDYWRAFVTHCAQYHDHRPRVDPITVGYVDRETEQLMDGNFGFEEECRIAVNSSDDPLTQAIWGRAHLKAQKLASKLAVADDYLTPRITTAHVDWSIDYVRRDIAVMERRQSAGQIGIDDDAREKAVIKILRDYLVHPVPKSYEVPQALRDNGIATFDYLRRRTHNLSAFKQHRGDANEALKQTIRNLQDRSFLIEVPKHSLAENYKHFGKAYRICGLPGESK